MKRSFAVVLVLGFSAFGCGGDDSSSKGDGGADSGMTADAAPVATCSDTMRTQCLNQLSCFTNIFTACIPSGSCTMGAQVVVGSELVAPMCFGNGVKSTTNASIANPLMATGTAYKPGGTVCYKFDSLTTTSGDNTVVYKDASGTTLATQKSFGNGSPTKITCAGMAEVTLSAGCAACGGAGGTIDKCVQGTCTAP